MGKLNYVLVNADILPQVYSKVLEAKAYLASGDAQSATQAAKMAGISRSAYYKYKDSVFETLSLTLADNKGVLSAVVNEIFLVDANVLSINQEVPQNGVAKVSLTMRVAEMAVSVDELVETLKKVNGVKAVNR